MKPITAHSSYYELLEVSVDASSEDIAYAARRLLKLYDGDQVSIYGLIDEEESEQLRARIRLAAEVLADPAQRREYDASLGLPSRGAYDSPQQKVAEVRPINSSTNAKRADPFPRELPPVHRELPGVSRDMTAAQRDLPPFQRDTAPTGIPGEHRSRGSGIEPPPPLESPPSTATPLRVYDHQKAVPYGYEASNFMETPVPVVMRTPVPTRIVDVPPGTIVNGELLRQARVAQGLTVARLAERTRIGSSHIESIEADRLDRLPAMVYLRGMLMSVAREIGLDPQQVVKGYVAMLENMNR